MTERQDAIALYGESVTTLLMELSDATDHGVFIRPEGCGLWLVRIGRESFHGVSQYHALEQAAIHLGIRQPKRVYTP